MLRADRRHQILFAISLAAAVIACGGEPSTDNAAARDAAAESASATPGATVPEAGPPVPLPDTADTTRSTSVRPTPPVHDSARVRDTARATPPTANEQQDAAQLLRRTAQAYGGMRTIQAQFAMVTENPLLRNPVASHGMLYQRRPDRILLRFEQPKDDLILGDGEYFWVYYPSTDPTQVIRTAAAVDAAGSVDLWAQFVGDPVARFEHTFEGRESVGGRETAVITLLPRRDPGYRQLKVWIDTQDFIVRRFEITEHNGTVRLIDLSDIVVNPTLAADLFRFVPPAGVRVVERG